MNKVQLVAMIAVGRIPAAESRGFAVSVYHWPLREILSSVSICGRNGFIEWGNCLTGEIDYLRSLSIFKVCGCFIHSLCAS